MSLHIIGFIMLMVSCTNRDTTVDKGKLLASDYRLFQDTPAWNLAKAVEDGDTSGIKLIIQKNKSLIDYKDPIYGQALLMIAVFRQNYNSVKTLLELGADPNKQDSREGMSALMKAAGIGGRGSAGPDSRFLQILLKYGADPNAIQKPAKGQRNPNYFTPLTIASLTGVLEYVKILVNAGADVNSGSKQGFCALFAAMAGRNPDIVLYLLQKGADHKQPMYRTVKGQDIYILDAINNLSIEKGTVEYNKMQKVLDFLKEKGISRN